LIAIEAARGGPGKRMRDHGHHRQLHQDRRRLHVAHTDEEPTDFLTRKAGFGRQDAARIIDTVLREEGRPAETVFDFVQGITAVARSRQQQDAKLEMEHKAKRLLDRAA
jgi:hypothetical protein